MLVLADTVSDRLSDTEAPDGCGLAGWEEFLPANLVVVLAAESRTGLTELVDL